MIKTLFIFRHGETDWNREMRLQGGTDIPLNETGRKQAQRLREFFLRNPIEIILSSDLDRAHETARIAAGHHESDFRIPIQLDSRLRETNLGDAEGLTQDQFLDRFGSELLELWRRYPDLDHAKFPNGETKAEHLRRTLAAIQEFVQVTPHERIGIATHGGSMRRLIHHWRPDLPAPVMIPNCTVYKVIYDLARGAWTVEMEPVCT